jgi:DNA invertase Pin-like site-specific DNA recombinase
MIELRGKDGGLYKRASRDTAVGTRREGVSVESQDEEGHERADELGVRIVDVYNDNNLSGSEFRQKERVDWPRMLDDIETGRLQVIIMWDTSRGSRDLEDWIKFLKLIARKNVPIHAVSHDRTYDPTNHRDWQILAEDGVKNDAYSKQLSANLKRGFKYAARKGRPRGKAAFGWRRVYDPDSGDMLTQEPIPEYRKYVEEMFTRYVSGMGRKKLAIEWNERNALPETHPDWVPKSRDGKPWKHSTITKLLRNPVYIGKFRNNVTGELQDGNWDGFIDEDVWWAAQRLMDSALTSTVDPHTKYFLTQIARCGVCGSRVRPLRLAYGCSGKEDDGTPKPTGAGCVAMKREWLDDIVFDKLADLLCDPLLVAKFTESDTAGQAEARARAKELRAQLDAAWEKVYACEPGYSHDRVAQMDAKWTPEIERLEEKAAAGLEPGKALALDIHQAAANLGLELAELKEFILDVLRNETPLGGQRSLARIFFQSIRIMPCDRPGSRVVDPSRVIIE